MELFTSILLRLFFPCKKYSNPIHKNIGKPCHCLTKNEWFNKNLPKIVNENLVDSTFLK